MLPGKITLALKKTANMKKIISCSMRLVKIGNAYVKSVHS